MIGVNSQVVARVIAALLEDPQASASVIEVSNDRGAVTLSGTVLSEMARRAVEEIVRRQEGVVTVINDLRVAPHRRNQRRLYDSGSRSEVVAPLRTHT